jgi:hypothetical protein
VEKEEMLKIGEALPASDVEMMNIDGSMITLQDIAKQNGLLVIFSCNTCPFVIGNGSKSEGWENRYPALGELCEKMNIGMVLINSNEGKREAGDSFEDMQNHYKENNYNSYYVLDQNSLVADMFGALTTPHVYLFDSKFELVYRGAIDDNVNKRSEVKEHYLENAIKNMVNGEKINPETTKQLGCSIKRI